MHKLYHKDDIKSSLYNELLNIINSNNVDYYKEIIADIPILDDNGELNNQHILIKNLLFKILNSKNPEFGSISLNNKFFKRVFRSAPKLNKCNKNFIGKLPEIFLKKHKNKLQKRLIAHKIFTLLYNYSTELNLNVNSISEKLIEERLNNLSIELGALTLQKVRIKFIDCGTFGNCYKVDAGKESFAYKVFYPHKKFEDPIIRDGHGYSVEPETAYYCSKSLDRKNFATFYCANIANLQNPACFMLTKFEKPKSKPYEHSPIKYLYLSEEENKEDNIIGNKIIDFGGVHEVDKRFKDKKLYRIICKVMANLNRNVDKNNFTIKWSINSFNITKLRKYFLDKNYYQAVNIICEKIEMPACIKQTLLNITNAKPVFYTQEFNPDKSKNIQELINISYKFNNFRIINNFTDKYLFVSINNKLRRYYYNPAKHITKILDL